MSVFEILLSFQGRIGRTTWWVASIGLSFLQIFTAFVLLKMLGTDAKSSAMPLLQLAYLWPILALNTKRLHDRNKSGWWQLAPWAGLLFSLLGLALLQAKLSGLGLILSLAGFVVTLMGLWVLIELMFFPGSAESNDHGARGVIRFELFDSEAEAGEMRPVAIQRAVAPQTAPALRPSNVRPDRRPGFGQRSPA